MSQVLSEIGQELEEARKHKKLKIEQLADKLKIRQRYLQAIERGELDELPVSAYVIGYLRSYSNALGLDGDAVVTRFKEEMESTGVEALVLLEPNKKEMRPLPLILLVSLVAALGLYVYWYKGSSDIQSKLAMAMQHFKQEKTEKNAPLTPPEGVKKMDVATLPRTLEGQSGSTVPQGNIPQNIVVVSNISKAVGENTTIVLLAKKTTWVQLLTKDNNFLLEKKLHPGESYDIPSREDLVIRSGKPEYIEVYARGGGKEALLGTLSTFLSQLPDLSPASGIPMEE